MKKLNFKGSGELLTREQMRTVTGGDGYGGGDGKYCYAHCPGDDVQVADCSREAAEKACGGTLPADGCTCA